MNSEAPGKLQEKRTREPLGTSGPGGVITSTGAAVGVMGVGVGGDVVVGVGEGLCDVVGSERFRKND